MRIITLMLFLSTLGFSKDILSINLGTDFSYSDLDSSCHLYPLGKRFILAAEIEDGEMITAKLRRPMMDKKVEVIELSKEEMSGIEFQNNNDNFILTRLGASPGILAMFFQGGSEEINKCAPPEELVSISPSNFSFQFTAPPAGGKLPVKTHSNKAVFNGSTKSGKTFRIELTVTQEHYRLLANEGRHWECNGYCFLGGDVPVNPFQPVSSTGATEEEARANIDCGMYQETGIVCKEVEAD